MHFNFARKITPILTLNILEVDIILDNSVFTGNFQGDLVVLDLLFFFGFCLLRHHEFGVGGVVAMLDLDFSFVHVEAGVV